MNLALSSETNAVGLKLKGKTDCKVRSFLQHHQAFLSSAERARRTLLIKDLDELVRQWVQTVANKYHIPLPKHVEQLSRVFAFGSHALGVDGPGSDVDVVVLTPSFVSRQEHFFGHKNRAFTEARAEGCFGTCMLDILYSLSQAEQIVALRDAYAPVIRFLFHGINVDMQCAPLTVRYLPFPLDILDNTLLKDVDPGTSRSASGVRSDQAMMRSVPSYDTFCSVLRMVKLWAKRRCIYSSLHGYLGGISWAILAARICQTYEGYSGVKLLALFFKTYAAWKWAPFPSWKPVRMSFKNDHGLWTNWDSWMPPTTYYQNPMQIICPVFPFTNTSYNVCRATHKVIMKEIDRACQIMEQVTRATITIHEGLVKLVEIYPFDHTFPLYLIIDVKANDAKEHREWQNFVESRIRRLTYEMEQTCNLQDIRPFPDAVKSICDKTHERISSFFVGLGPQTLDENIGNTNSVLGLSLTKAVRSWETSINTWKLKKPGMHLSVRMSSGIKHSLKGRKRENEKSSGTKRKRGECEKNY